MAHDALIYTSPYQATPFSGPRTRKLLNSNFLSDIYKAFYFRPKRSRTASGVAAVTSSAYLVPVTPLPQSFRDRRLSVITFFYSCALLVASNSFSILFRQSTMSSVYDKTLGFRARVLIKCPTSSSSWALGDILTCKTRTHSETAGSMEEITGTCTATDVVEEPTSGRGATEVIIKIKIQYIALPLRIQTES